jgi:hypothetical protein
MPRRNGKYTADMEHRLLWLKEIEWATLGDMRDAFMIADRRELGAWAERMTREGVLVKSERNGQPVYRLSESVRLGI